MSDFNSLGLAEPVLRAVTEAGYDQPTPIQAQAIPVMLKGGDLMGLAQTGTGKTAAFVLPLIDQLMADGKRPPGRSCRALVLAPTRELAAQIGQSIKTYSEHTPISHAVVFGGVKPGPQVRALARGVDILVATPGRLLDHLGAGKARLDLTTRVVLDEADQMLDLGFIPAIRRILTAVGPDRQTVMFSATMPKQIKKLAEDFLVSPKTVSVTPPSRPVERIDQKVLFVDPVDKAKALVDLMAPEAGKRTIIFTRTKHRADRVAKKLVSYGHKAHAIHGNKSQGQRERALDAFKTGAAPVLVATDIAARGIDVDGVELVVNFELPNVAESYVHRIGRTARAGASGRAVALCAPDERALLAAIEKLMGRSVEPLNDAPPPPKPAKGEDAKSGQHRRRRRPRRKGPRGSGEKQAA